MRRHACAQSYSHTYTLNYGLFAPKTIRSWERKFQVWNYRSVELLLPGTFVPTNEYSKERILYVRKNEQN